MRVATWNTEWVFRSRRAGITDALMRSVADVIVGTEVLIDLLPAYEYVIDAGTDWGYELSDDRRRKVAMWSRRPWTDVSLVDDPEVPGGRLVAATTELDGGAIRVIGVCVPWVQAHVSSGRRDRTSWEDHLAFLAAMPEIVADRALGTVIAGDFNQFIPRMRQPKEVFDALNDVLRDFNVATAGDTGHGALIDHVAHSRDLTAQLVDIICPHQGDLKLSDHHGVVVDLQR